MGTIDEIKMMQGQGKNDAEIQSALKAKGVTDTAIAEGMSQAKIKDAVGQAPGNEPPPMGAPQGQPPSEFVQGGAPATTEYSAAVPKGSMGYEGMQPSMLGGPEGQAQEQGGGDVQEYSAGGGEGYGGGAYPEYQPYQEAMSSDVIKEISEQVVGERLAVVQDKMEEAIRFKVPAETKLKNLDERLRKIEQVLDKMQLAILHKVGEYVTDVKDIKHELEETQKSFKSLLPHHHKKAHGEHHAKKHVKKKGKKKRVP
ncbi:MAG: hypothetical protein ABIG28_03710 [archaeon]